MKSLTVRKNIKRSHNKRSHNKRSHNKRSHNKRRSNKRRSHKKRHTYKKNYKGGVRMKYNPLYAEHTHTSFSALMRMIDKSTISTLSYDSLSGFVFKITVNEEDYEPEFFSLNDKGTALSIPVKQLVLKIVIIESVPVVKPYELIPKSGDYILKRGETYEKFENEAKTQQYIYKGTIKPSGKPICPGIVDLSFFYQYESLLFLTKLSQKTNSADKTTRHILNFLKNKHLGMIAMELADNTMALNDILKYKQPPIPANLYVKGFCMAVAEILILFIKNEYVHCDLHLGNVLVEQYNISEVDTDDYIPKVKLIDFGNILDLTSISSDIKKFYSTLFGADADADADYAEISNLDVTDLWYDDDEKGLISEKFTKIIRFIARIDYAKNYATYYSAYGDYIKKPQMMEILNSLYGGEDNAREFYMNPYFGISGKTIEYYQLIHYFFVTLTKVPIGARNSLSKLAIERMVTDKKIFSITVADDIPPHRRINEEYKQPAPETSRSASESAPSPKRQRV